MQVSLIGRPHSFEDSSSAPPPVRFCSPVPESFTADGITTGQDLGLYLQQVGAECPTAGRRRDWTRVAESPPASPMRAPAPFGESVGEQSELTGPHAPQPDPDGSNYGKVSRPRLRLVLGRTAWRRRPAQHAHVAS